MNSKDQQMQAFKDINNKDINLNDINNNTLLQESLPNNNDNHITNSNIVLNLNYSKDSELISEKTQIQNNKLQLKNINSEKSQIEKNIEENRSTTANEQDSIGIKKINEDQKNKEKKINKKNRRIQINLDNNIYYHYQKESCLDDYYETYNKNFELINLDSKNKKMDLDNYMKMIKSKKNLIPCIKKYDKNSIKIALNYKECENLSEREIIPDLYEEEEEDIRSLEKSLERSIDKSFDKSYDKWYGQSLNDKIEGTISDSFNTSNSNMNDSNVNNTGRKIINQLQEMFIEEVDEEQNEENEKDDKKDILIDEEKK